MSDATVSSQTHHGTGGVLLGVVGSPDVVANSLSPRMMTAALEALGIVGRYVPLPILEADAEETFAGLQARGFQGCNVTMPYKAVAARIADERSSRVERTGVANTLLARADGSIFADATDGSGLQAAFEARDMDLGGASVTILGAGGSAIEAAVACIDSGVARIHIVNRTRAAADALARSLQLIAPALELQVHDRLPIREAVHVLIGCVPAAASTPSEFEDLAGDPSFVDFAYLRGGGPTPLMVAAASRRAHCIDGRELLVRQGAAALRVWFEVEPPIEVMQRAVRS